MKTLFTAEETGYSLTFSLFLFSLSEESEYEHIRKWFNALVKSTLTVVTLTCPSF